MTQVALDAHIGAFGSIFLAIIIFFFAFSSLVGNYYYGETNIAFLKNSPVFLNIYRVIVLAMIMFGSLASVQIVWNMADLFMALMAVVNLIAILFLGRIAFRILQDYIDQKKKESTHNSIILELKD